VVAIDPPASARRGADRCGIVCAGNDQRLDDIARRKSADVLLEEKVERISARLDDLILKCRRPALETRASQAATAPSEHKSAFDAYVRKGDTNALHRLEAKALSAGIGLDGGFTVPHETEAAIGRLLQLASPMRQVASVRQVSAAVYKKPFTTQGADAGWVASKLPPAVLAR
jgi:HK97 family phage major capsid protein